MQNIEWEGMNSYLNKLPLHKKINCLQMIHDWQHVGRQKQKFAESKKKVVNKQSLVNKHHQLIEEVIKLDATCPFTYAFHALYSNRSNGNTERDNHANPEDNAKYWSE